MEDVADLLPSNHVSGQGRRGVGMSGVAVAHYRGSKRGADAALFRCVVLYVILCMLCYVMWNAMIEIDHYRNK